MDEGVLQEWLVGPGDRVRKGDVVAVVETDKAAIEVECFESGTVGQLLVPPGTRVPVGTPLAVIQGEGAPEEQARIAAEQGSPWPPRRSPKFPNGRRPARPSAPRLNRSRSRTTSVRGLAGRQSASGSRFRSQYARSPGRSPPGSPYVQRAASRTRRRRCPPRPSRPWEPDPWCGTSRRCGAST
ncbi:biotin/lipoyl-containing protein [Streptomyces sp. NBC_01764]|uniref:biotin/lipoyl-containing protein n=1 Tax=Streptomyces sp. NBC_01764 TaxID=2975935 RepID=UPI002B1CAA07|nr:biotin/lipoyl-containing protein [Streptomyces sp. NBC_01764]